MINFIKKKEEIKTGLDRAKQLEELDKNLSTLEELESEDKEFQQTVQKIRKIINTDLKKQSR
jgi:predicted aldo/keto reductase-like oxidoreductase